MEFASKSHGQPHYLTTEHTSHFPSQKFAGHGTQTVGSYNSSNNNNEHSVLPHKTEGSHNESADNVLTRNKDGYDTSQNQQESNGRASFISKKDMKDMRDIRDINDKSFGRPGADIVARDKDVIHSRSLLGSTVRSDNKPCHYTSADYQSYDSNKISCTRICNFREVKALFAEHEAITNNHTMIEVMDSQNNLLLTEEALDEG